MKQAPRFIEFRAPPVVALAGPDQMTSRPTTRGPGAPHPCPKGTLPCNCHPLLAWYNFVVPTPFRPQSYFIYTAPQIFAQTLKVVHMLQFSFFLNPHPRIFVASRTPPDWGRGQACKRYVPLTRELNLRPFRSRANALTTPASAGLAFNTT